MFINCIFLAIVCAIDYKGEDFETLGKVKGQFTCTSELGATAVPGLIEPPILSRSVGYLEAEPYAGKTAGKTAGKSRSKINTAEQRQFRIVRRIIACLCSSCFPTFTLSNEYKCTARWKPANTNGLCLTPGFLQSRFGLV